MKVTDYQILQRSAEGFATVDMDGPIPDIMVEGSRICVGAWREADNLMIVPWTPAKIDENGWRVQITLPEGGLYRLEAIMENGSYYGNWGLRIQCIRHVGVGDLYLLAGQSNMAGYGKDMAFDPPALGVHLYANNGKWDVAAHPLNDPVGSIYPENIEYTSGTSPALSFARRLRESIGVPVGLVQASLGGSPLSAWHPEEDGYLYRAMIRRIDAVGPVKGILWYQGCSDTDEPSTAANYLERFRRAVFLWREALGPVPVLTVQLNRVQGPQSWEYSRRWGMVKEAQRQAALQIPDVYVVPAYDLLLSDGIHNSAGANVILGERLAYTALAGVYGMAGKMAYSVERVEYIDETHVRMCFPREFALEVINSEAFDLKVMDEAGEAGCTFAEFDRGTVVVTVERPFTLPASFSAYAGSCVSAFHIRDIYGMPMLACQDVEICKQ